MPACRVEFHTGLADAMDFACRLLRKAHRQGHRVLVTAPAGKLATLDGLLWTFDAESFVPHVIVPGPAADVLARTPVWLCDSTPPGELPALLLNLGAAAPASLAPFERVIEIVSHDVDEAQAGRERWRAYKALGLEIVHHQAGPVSGARD